MNPKSPILFCFLFCFGLLFSSHAQTHQIDLSEENLNLSSTAFKVKQVIDINRKGTSIGLLQRGAFNKQIPAFMSIPLPNALLELFQRTNPQSDAEPLIIRVNRFEIAEQVMTTREYAFFKISLDFISQNDDGYQLVSP